MHEDIAIRLKRLKELAKSEFASRNSLAQLKLNDHLFEVSGNGRNPYAFIIADAWFRIEIAKQGAKTVPMAYSKIASACLTTSGPDEVVHDLSKVISAIGALSEPPSVSRADLCVDFITDYPLDSIQNSEWVTRAKNFDNHIASRRFSGISIASGSPLSARLYSKTLEMQKNPRPYLEELWRQQGWDGVSEVWRLEFQFRRQALRDLNVVRYTDLIESLASIWRYSTFEWLRHTTSNSTDLNQSRWPSSALWQALQAAPWSGLNEVKRVNSERSRGPTDRSLFINGLSTLTSFMARANLLDAGEAALAYVEAAREYHNKLAFRSETGSGKGSGVDFENYVLTKVREKRKAYNMVRNLPLDGSTHPADKDYADEYRKRSNGDY
tara:strand:+ start:5539 stop:6684 length:1146 start_codon:yes stop_codon:yes gene_type:complete